MGLASTEGLERTLDIYGIAKLNVTDRLTSTNGNVLRGKLMKANEDALWWNAERLKPFHDALIQTTLCFDRAAGQNEDADVRKAIWIRAIEPTQES